MISPLSSSISARASSLLSGFILNLVMRDCIDAPFPCAGLSTLARGPACASGASLARLPLGRELLRHGKSRAAETKGRGTCTPRALTCYNAPSPTLLAAGQAARLAVPF